MANKAAGTIVFFIVMACLTGCDPEALVKRKVPEPIQDLLTLGSAASLKTPLTPEAIQIVSPKKDTVYPSHQPTTFQVNLKAPGDKPFEDPIITWTLFPEGKGQQPLGNGLSLKKKLEPGKYRVEVTLAVKDQKVSQTINFRQAMMMRGKTVLANGKPVAGVELELKDLDENLISKTQSGDNGTFIVEIPSDNPFRLSPSKKKFSFNPLSKVIKYNPEEQIDFTGFEVEISDVLLVASVDATEPALSICPYQELYLKYKLQSDTPPKKIEAQLIQREKESERLHSFEDISTTEKIGEPLKLKAPLLHGPLAPHYRLRLVVTDEHGQKFSMESRDLYSMDMAACIKSKMAQAVALQTKGELEPAIKEYNQVEELYRNVHEPALYTSLMEKLYFNRGLARLALALNADSGNRQRFLSTSSQDFNAVLKLHKNDIEALFYRGLISHLAKGYDPAIQDYTDVLQSDPNYPLITQLRGMAFVGTGVKRNLLSAIYDFGDALRANSSNKDLRKIRAETLKLYAENQNEKDDSVLDSSRIRLPKPEEGLDLQKIRK
ncbi:tetratricopeptide repeat protein [Desulfomonile tiedjei]|uniref:Uncharacterized protein n=1 Tax=Desulfomonile tiedjei (strain ATCC 49306 / DSM 6799 / DCB-1) TaxID=706587 RepID=I4C0X0_DESTA|nr:hypothetical protein [Desulfomonile tiedjei]AFM23211.1 hypothetical protein Desti_0477 [Desulfomonile tiedjei DSM 6799]